jgi:prolyl-tRNA editing enzyme YbaK/EbsC (Cys-tRNA(Pro) deacylase)
MHQEQSYVEEFAKKLGIDIEFRGHSRATDTCYEKADMINWKPERVVKAVYFHNNGNFIGIVRPELGDLIRQKPILQECLGFSGNEAKSYHANSKVPKGMEIGTCTPFPLESSLRTEISDIIITKQSSIQDQVVDISIGGIGEAAHKISANLPYWGIYAILKEKFGDRIHTY